MGEMLGGGHIVKRYDNEITQLRGLVLEMGEVVSKQLNDAVEAMSAKDVNLAHKVVARERRINDLDMAANEECVNLLAVRAPVASDLRLFMTLSKCVTDLERIGDEAEQIANSIVRLFEKEMNIARPPLIYDVSMLGDKAIEMLTGALQVIESEDVDLAVKVIQNDKYLDKLFNDALRRLTTFVLEDSRHIGSVIDVIFVLRALERIGDYAQNMCEHMIYAVKGKDVRYIQKEHLSEGYLDDE